MAYLPLAEDIPITFDRCCWIVYPSAMSKILNDGKTCWLCRQGRVVKEVAYLPLAEDIPITFNSCRKGPRGIDWRADKDAEFCWIEAQVRTADI